MSSRADEIRAKIAKSKARAEASSEPSAQPVQRPRQKPVRRTVDLSPHHHAELDAWCAETARQLGKARVTGQAVLSTLVGRLLTDETLARRIRQDLAEMS